MCGTYGVKLIFRLGGTMVRNRQTPIESKLSRNLGTVYGPPGGYGATIGWCCTAALVTCVERGTGRSLFFCYPNFIVCNLGHYRDANCIERSS